ncbi:MAG: hypothetical protein HY020_19795 [Burkholderiales bacterium]|nr:hypothetical protein [Burkholderiales bacterium]
MATLHGVHGTCITHAKNILDKGVEAQPNGGRAGSGFYLWAFATEGGRKRAWQLADDWHADWLRKGHFGGCAEQGCAILTFELEIDLRAYLNLNQARHHERLAENHSRMPDLPVYKVFDEYIESQSVFRQGQGGPPHWPSSKPWSLTRSLQNELGAGS